MPLKISNDLHVDSKTPSIQTMTHPLLNMIELPKHKVDIDKHNRESKDEIIDISPDGTWGNVSKAICNVHLKKESM